HDFGLAEGQLFIVMEHVPGADLKSMLRKRGRFTIEDTVALMVQACAGLGYAHRAGLVHCDVKPHNFLITPDMRLKVTDFGIARALATIRPGDRDAVVWGSPQYFSPEQARGIAPSPASDVYSLGVVMYEMLTGTLPFAGATAEDLARAHVNSRPIPLREYLPDAPTALIEIENKILAKEPSARYRTADQLGRVLLRFGTLREETPPQLNLTPEVANGFEEPPPVSRTQPKRAPVFEPDSSPFQLDIDWLTIGLWLLMLIAVGGLVPVWMAAWFAWNP
ncbi:MAG: serine/threonine-protein kinase, partial [Chloroflexota bacterium]